MRKKCGYLVLAVLMAIVLGTVNGCFLKSSEPAAPAEDETAPATDEAAEQADLPPQPVPTTPGEAAQEQARQANLRVKCQNNLKQMGLVFKIYSLEHNGAWPTLSEPGRFMCDAGVIFPDYLTDTTVLVCPGDPDGQPEGSGEALVDDQSYFYLGYAMTGEFTARAFLDAYAEQASGSGDFSTALQHGGVTLHNLAEGVERELDGASQSEIPVLFDRSPTHHQPAGINVLYMDGHVEYVTMGSKFPAQTWFLDGLARMESKN